MKSKEDIKVLMLHIIGLVVHLSSIGHAKLSFIAAILKKEVHELKPYCHELGMIVDPAKTKQENGSQVDDFIISLSKRKPEEAEANEPKTIEEEKVKS